MLQFKPENYPRDILSLIFAQIDDRRDLYAVAIVSHTFNTTATPVRFELRVKSSDPQPQALNNS